MVIPAESVPRSEQGPAAAFGTLAQRLRPRLISFLRRRVSDPLTVEDLTQETLCKAWMAWDRFDGDQPLAWVFRIAQNVATDYYRHHRLVQMLSLEELLDAMTASARTSKAHTRLPTAWAARFAAPDPTPEQAVLDAEAAAQLEALVGQCLAHGAAAVRLTAGGATYDEIAAAQETSRSAVKSLLSRTRQELRLAVAGGTVRGQRPVPPGAAAPVCPVLPWLAAHHAELGPAQQRVAAAIPAALAGNLWISAKRLTRPLGVAPTIAEALAQRLGYATWPQLRTQLRTECRARAQDGAQGEEAG